MTLGDAAVSGFEALTIAWIAASSPWPKTRMPYQDAPLAPEQVALVQAWIDAGAPGPDDRAAEAVPPASGPAAGRSLGVRE
jgi:hypothetical protein